MTHEKIVGGNPVKNSTLFEKKENTKILIKVTKHIYKIEKKNRRIRKKLKTKNRAKIAQTSKILKRKKTLRLVKIRKISKK